jgi:hypothetical protein
MKAAVAGLSGSLALVLLLPMEAGVPIPVPADLVMFTVGERVAAGKFPLWLAVAGFEVIAVLGTTALFLACRGPAQRIITRFGPRQRPGPDRDGRAGRRHGGLLAGQAAQAGGRAWGLDGGELPGVHRRDPAHRAGARPGRAGRAGPGPPGTR